MAWDPTFMEILCELFTNADTYWLYIYSMMVTSISIVGLGRQLCLQRESKINGFPIALFPYTITSHYSLYLSSHITPKSCSSYNEKVEIVWLVIVQPVTSSLYVLDHSQGKEPPYLTNIGLTLTETKSRYLHVYAYKISEEVQGQGSEH